MCLLCLLHVPKEDKTIVIYITACYHGEPGRWNQNRDVSVPLCPHSSIKHADIWLPHVRTLTLSMWCWAGFALPDISTHCPSLHGESAGAQVTRCSDGRRFNPWPLQPGCQGGIPKPELLTKTRLWCRMEPLVNCKQHVCGCTTVVLLAKMVAGTICCRLMTGNGISPSHYYSELHLRVKTVLQGILNTTAHWNVCFMRLKKQKKSHPPSCGWEIQWRAA